MNDTANSTIAITGIGTVLPNTADSHAFWRNIRDGVPQVDRLTRFDGTADGLNVHASAEINGFEWSDYLSALPGRHANKYTREILIAMSAMVSALDDAGHRRSDVSGPGLSIVQSSSRSTLEWWHQAMKVNPTEAYGDSGAMFRGLNGCPASLSAIYLGAKGLVTSLSSACVGGHHALGIAMDQLKMGRADIVLAGGHEFPILSEVARCYSAMGSGVLSQEDSVPSSAVKPYDIRRDGFALGEGAVTLCLEREADARARGARIYGLLLAHTPINEANHGTNMDLEGYVTAGAMKRALASGKRSASDLDYLCGHGTATRYNDVAECRALKKLYPGRLSTNLPPHGSNKPIYGHTFGMAGVINVAAVALALHHQVLPRTANLSVPDPECDTDHVAEGPRTTRVETALSLSFAFGSQTSVMALARA